MTADHLEVEDKYHLDESAVLPDFSTIPGVKSVSVVDHELVATYYDTPGLVLAASGVTLRRRTGGEDAGWHLKLPTAEGRLEIALPLGRALRSPPAALRTVVSGFVRGQELAPVVTIRTDRRAQRLHGKKGDVLAEVADDRVSAEPVPSDGSEPVTWREAEIELVSGKLSMLVRASDLMASVGARRSESPSKLVQALGDRLPRAEPVARPEPRKNGPAAEVIQLRLLTQVTALRQQDPWVRYDAPEAVHDLRVTVRRLRHALASYRPFLDPELTDPLRDELGWLGAVLGGPRDAEVLDQLLRGLVADEDPALVTGPVRDRLQRDFRLRYDAARADLLSAMDSRRYFDLVDRLQALAEDPPWTDAAGKKARRALSKALDGDWRRLRARILVAAERADRGQGEPGDLHDVRKAAKRVRYAAEALAPILGKSARRMVSSHERIQNVLGDQHDDAEAQAALVGLARDASDAGESAFTYGLLHARLQARSATHVAAFEEAWQDSLTARARMLNR
jgi:CHAD domain-containing protein